MLNDTEFTSEIHNVISSFAENKQEYQSKKVLWEFLKQNMACVAKTHSSQKNRAERKKIAEVREKIEILESIDKDLVTQYYKFH